jgi:hypothetical protein
VKAEVTSPCCIDNDGNAVFVSLLNQRRQIGESAEVARFGEKQGDWLLIDDSFKGCKGYSDGNTSCLIDIGSEPDWFKPCENDRRENGAMRCSSDGDLLTRFSECQDDRLVGVG